MTKHQFGPHSGGSKGKGHRIFIFGPTCTVTRKMRYALKVERDRVVKAWTDEQIPRVRCLVLRELQQFDLRQLALEQIRWLAKYETRKLLGPAVENQIKKEVRRLVKRSDFPVIVWTKQHGERIIQEEMARTEREHLTEASLRNAVYAQSRRNP